MALPNTSQAVIHDTASEHDPDGVHIGDKQTAGHRLALIARKNLYGEPDLVASGPVFQSMEIKDDGSVVITFSDIGGGLKFKGMPEGTKTATGEQIGFGIAGEDGQYVCADEVTIDGATVTLRSAAVERPVSIRYAWSSNPVANLYNAEDLPANSFRAGETKDPE